MNLIYFLVLKPRKKSHNQIPNQYTGQGFESYTSSSVISPTCSCTFISHKLKISNMKCRIRKVKPTIKEITGTFTPIAIFYNFWQSNKILKWCDCAIVRPRLLHAVLFGTWFWYMQGLFLSDAFLLLTVLVGSASFCGRFAPCWTIWT